MSAATEISVRPVQPQDLLQIAQIFNYWILESKFSLLEAPLSLADMTEIYRKVKAKGLPFLVATMASSPSEVLGFIYAAPEVSRLVRIPGLVANLLFIRPGLKGLKLFERLLAPYLRILLAYPWFRGSISETNAGNTHIHHKHSVGYMLGKMPPLVMQGAFVKQGEWLNQGLEFFPRGLFEAVVENYEDLMHVKV